MLEAMEPVYCNRAYLMNASREELECMFFVAAPRFNLLRESICLQVFACVVWLCFNNYLAISSSAKLPGWLDSGQQALFAAFSVSDDNLLTQLVEALCHLSLVTQLVHERCQCYLCDVAVLS
jgi:hypothetical protein